jgi:hypothetical protein
MSRRWRLIVAAALFVGWLSYLGYAALKKDRGPVISRAQAAAAGYAVVAVIESSEDGKPLKKVKVHELLSTKGPDAGSEIEVENLPAASDKSGFTGPGEYLLLLTGPPYYVVGQQRSPGNDLSGVGPPLVYRFSENVRKQFEKLPKPSEPSDQKPRPID